MATIADAMRRGDLVWYDLPDTETREPVRALYLSRGLVEWVDTTEFLYETQIGGRTLFEHLDQMFCDYCCAKRPSAGDLRRVMPTNRGFWKFLPPGLRVFGWCPKKNSFIAVNAAKAEECHGPRSVVKQKATDVRTYIQSVGLSHLVVRGDINAILS